MCCRSWSFATPGHGATARRSRGWQLQAGHIEAQHRSAWRVSLVRRPGSCAPLHRQRHQHAPPVQRTQRRLCEGRVPRARGRTGMSRAVNPAQEGTKAAAWYRLDVPPAARRRFARGYRSKLMSSHSRTSMQSWRRAVREADDFYAQIQHDLADADRRLVQRQAFAGMIWSKQFFYFDVPEWLKGDETQIAPPTQRKHGRNWEWDHLNNADIISMPDKWEYPWYAAWDLAFHTLPLALIDAEFAKEQLVLLTREWYMHPNGQMPAYEWAFGDVNPPVHAWATWRVFQIDRKQRGDDGDLKFLERVFHKLLLNFTWWVNRKDARRPQRLPGRLPRPRQHRRLRPQRARCRPAATSTRRTAPAGWRCTRSTSCASRSSSPSTTTCTRTRHQVLRTLPAHRGSDEHLRRRRRRPVGRRGQVLLRRAAHARRPH